MNIKEKQELMLLKQSLNAIRRDVDEQLNAIETTIDAMLPVEIKKRASRHRSRGDLESCWKYKYDKRNKVPANAKVSG